MPTLRFFSSSDFISAVDSASTSSANAEVVVGVDDRAGCSHWLHVLCCVGLAISLFVARGGCLLYSSPISFQFFLSSR